MSVRFREADHVRARDGRFAAKTGGVVSVAQAQKLRAQSSKVCDPSSGVPYDVQLPVFVYGTLRPGEGNYRHLLRGRTDSETSAALPGTRMWSNGAFPYVRETDDGEGVAGTVVTVGDANWSPTIERLDFLEGFRPGDTSNLYDRVARTVELDDGSSVLAWVYVTNVSPGDLDGRYRKVPSGDWFDR